MTIGNSAPNRVGYFLQRGCPVGFIWLNITEPGHRYHPGSVVHSVHESGGKLWLYTKGAGIGPNPGQNVSVGRFLFGNMHINVQNQMIQQQTGSRTPPWIP